MMTSKFIKRQPERNCLHNPTYYLCNNSDLSLVVKHTEAFQINFIKILTYAVNLKVYSAQDGAFRGLKQTEPLEALILYQHVSLRIQNPP